MDDHRARPHLPGRAEIDAYGGGGFRFAGLSHRGSILCLPSGVYAFAATSVGEIDVASLAPVLAERHDGIQFLIVGSGTRLARLAEAVRAPLRAAGISVDAMDTGAACRTYNVMLSERRPVAAVLLAVD
jgi:uncharacterized protein